MIDRAGRRSRLVCPPLPAPLHLLAGVMEWDALDWTDRLSVLRMATPLKLARDPDRLAASPGETVESWLVRHGQTERLREMLWRPLALAALNQPADRAGATLFARVLAEMFTRRRGRRAPRSADAAAGRDVRGAGARVHSRRRGGEVRTGATATIRLPGERHRWRRSRRRALDAAGGDCRGALVRVSQLFDGRLGRDRGIVERAEPDVVVADRDGQSLVRSAGARRAVRGIAR